MKTVLIFIVLFVSINGVSYAQQEVTGGEGNTTTGQMNLSILKNANYHASLFEEPVKLDNGIYYYPNDRGVIDSAAFTKLDEKHIGYGDLNGDGVPDAAAILMTDGGGSGLFVDLATVLNVKGLPVNVATESLGDRVRVKKVSIKNGLIIVNLLTHDVNDGQCCPSLDSTWRYKMDFQSINKQYGDKNNKESVPILKRLK